MQKGWPPPKRQIQYFRSQFGTRFYPVLGGGKHEILYFEGGVPFLNLLVLKRKGLISLC